MSEILLHAIRDVQKSTCAFCRYITANDTGTTGSHQAGFYIPKEAARLLFEDPVARGTNKDKFVEINWQNDFITQSRFVYYGKGTRNEFRITRFGRGFPFLEEDNVGDLLVLAQMDATDYVGYVLSSDEDIDEFLSFFNLSPEDTNQLINLEVKSKLQTTLSVLLDEFVSKYDDFPDTKVMASGARECYNRAFNVVERQIVSDPDQMILNWTDAEYTLFQKLEDKAYGPLIQKTFPDVKSLVEVANQILNRRKSRAGKSLEHHLASIFDVNDIIYEEQIVTEDNKKPDFVFPDGKCYHNFEFPSQFLTSLAAKTTCKDRWRQVINEANRIKLKHLFTLQQAISKNQLREMKEENVKLVVPHKYISSFPMEYQGEILDLSGFISFVRNQQAQIPKSYFIGKN